MKYTVVWKAAAEEELAQMWLDAADRSAVTVAANGIDRLLAAKPEEQGESRSGATQGMFIHPVGAFFDVSEEDRVVSVLRVWRVP